MSMKWPADPSGIEEALNWIEKMLHKYGLERREITRALMLSDELMHSLISHGEGAAEMQLDLRRWMGEILLEITVPGQAYDFAESLNYGIPLDMEELGPEAEISLRNRILRSYVDDLKYKNRRGLNSIFLTVQRSGKRSLYYTLTALFLAVFLALLLKGLLPGEILLFLDEKLLLPVKDVFMNALKAMVAPVVFFSLVSCFNQYGGLSYLSKLGGKVLVRYGLTTVLATGVGIGLYYLLEPVNFFFRGVMEADVSGVTESQLQVSLVDMLINIVPDNFIQPFLEPNLLQLIFLATLCGIATGMIGEHSSLLQGFFEACNALFLKITGLLVKFVPVVTFCSVFSLVLNTGLQSLLSVVNSVFVFLLSVLVMMLIYSLMMMMAGLSPLPFFKKYGPVMLQVFSTSSSNVSLPMNMEVSGTKLGISPRIYSFSLPLGASLNMDGACMRMSIFALALADMYGVEVGLSQLLPLALSVILLSIGAPGVPGSGLICLSLLLTQLNVPIEAMGLVIGIDPLICMFSTMSNCTGDVAVSAVVAKKMGLLDLELYNRMDV
ncbi:MAG: dicarboxylate/amino acid:cation symporter [Bacillota bacterium]|nr:dicarboxylate/amino acid:cation symporter [Bacillota bacterium]